MARLEHVPVEDLRQILAEVGDADATKRLMVAITYKEIDDMTQTDAAALYGFSSNWASKWFSRLERLVGEPFEFDVEYCERHVRRLMSEAGLSWKTARPQYYKSDERAQEAWQEGFKKSATTWTTNTQS